MNDFKPLTLSLVIPVYNEEDHIVACLSAIAAQTVKPLEVIVVDNGS
ncbi:MAG: glycosyltransferase, partial [bacterium]|nr:glycosyltransferase [bacterium]